MISQNALWYGGRLVDDTATTSTCSIDLSPVIAPFVTVVSVVQKRVHYALASKQLRLSRRLGCLTDTLADTDFSKPEAFLSKITKQTVTEATKNCSGAARRTVSTRTFRSATTISYGVSSTCIPSLFAIKRDRRIRTYTGEQQVLPVRGTWLKGAIGHRERSGGIPMSRELRPQVHSSTRGSTVSPTHV